MFMLLLSMHGIASPAPVPPRAPLHYRIVARTSTDIDLTSVGQAAMNVVMTSSAFVSVTTTDSAGGKVVHVVIDSSTFDAGAMSSALPPEFTASPNGASYHIYMVGGTPKGALLPTPATVQAAQLIPGIEIMLGGMHVGADNRGWTDTTRADTTVADASGKMSRITTWVVKPGSAGMTQIEGSWNGTTTVGSGPMQMEMKLIGTTLISAMSGQLSQEGTSKGTGQASMTIAGNSIPLKVTTEVSATHIP